MKAIFIISRIMFIAFVWTIGYFFWFQRLMLAMWRFDPLAKPHWEYIWNEWQNGWVIQSPYEWCFVIALFAMIPMWFIGWTILCSISWFSWFKAILMFPIKLIRNKIKTSLKPAPKAKVSRKKSYKQTRPPAIRVGSGKIKPIDKPAEQEKESKQEQPHSGKKQTSKPKNESAPTPTPAPKKEAPKARQTFSSGETVMDIIRSAGYRLISDIKINGKRVDFAGIARDHILLCLIDSEQGDWLADEERFNDEEPLWFSESNHRISPVRVILNARDALLPMLSGKMKELEIRPMVVVKQGTIINAEDMFEVWENLHVSVCRFEGGGPDEITELHEAIPHAESPDETVFREISSLLG